ncbi:hypothetical protein Purlil1_14073 [Purpureocillium lilacinum]|uniref:Cryptic loci regulator 2 C-terminal domain-containing protein n=1 Tax=Purpureocillium lilacinum TaxID=33203 RepID=A0ABR0BCB5_PURLI|nr:hypothetical protein Purlil1_14073 [Purpureocillium lilacinum]
MTKRPGEPLNGREKRLCNAIVPNQWSRYFDSQQWKLAQLDSTSADAHVSQTRLKLLRMAATERDTTFVVLHQLFCQWSLDRARVHNLLGIPPETVDSAFEMLSCLGPTSSTGKLTMSSMQLFASYPLLDADYSAGAKLYSDFLQIREQMAVLASHWDSLALRGPYTTPDSAVLCPSEVVGDALRDWVCVTGGRRSKLPDLPAELVMEIASHLLPTDVTSLILSSRSLYRAMETQLPHEKKIRCLVGGQERLAPAPRSGIPPWDAWQYQIPASTSILNLIIQAFNDETDYPHLQILERFLEIKPDLAGCPIMVLEDEMNWPTLEVCCRLNGRDMPCMSSCGRIRGVPLAPDKDGSIPDDYIILEPLHLAVYFGLDAFCQTLLRADASIISHEARGLPGLGKDWVSPLEIARRQGFRYLADMLDPSSVRPDLSRRIPAGLKVPPLWSSNPFMLQRGGEVVWYTAPHSRGWWLGICTDSRGMNIIPLRHSIPGKYERPETILPYNRPPRDNAQVDNEATKATAIAINAQHSLWGRLDTTLDPSNPRYYGCFLGAERVEVGDCLRLDECPCSPNRRRGRCPANSRVLAVRNIFCSGSGILTFHGDIYHLISGNAETPNDLPFVLEVQSRIASSGASILGLQPRVWRRFRADVERRQHEIAGRYYPRFQEDCLKSRFLPSMLTPARLHGLKLVGRLSTLGPCNLVRLEDTQRARCGEATTQC